MTHRDDQTGGRLSAYLRTARYNRVVDHVRGSVLEVGCGDSQLLAEHGDRFERYVGCDVDEGSVQRQANRFPQHRFARVDLDHEPLPDGWGDFDRVVATAVIEHIFNLELVMRKLVDALRPEGKIVITTPTPFGNDAVLPLTSRLGLTSRSAFDDHISVLNRRRVFVLAKEVGLRVEVYRRFQLGMNSLAVMSRA